MKELIGTQCTILLVDDEPLFREAASDALSGHFRAVLTASDANEALQIMQATSVDLVVTDYLMPGMNGVEFIRHLQKLHPSVPVIMVTGNGQNPEVIEAIKLGAFDILDKPFRTEILVNRIQNSLLLPQLVKILISVISQDPKMPTVDELLERPYAEQIKILHQYSALVRARSLKGKPKTPGQAA